jgi:hypothetical protein
MAGRKTYGKRLSRALKSITRWCKENRYWAKQEQHQELTAKLRGHYAYYELSLNYYNIGLFYEQVKGIRFKWLNQRSAQRSQKWQQFLAKRFFLEEADAAYLREGNWARPGLRDLRVGDRPVLPDIQVSSSISS